MLKLLHQTCFKPASTLPIVLALTACGGGSSSNPPPQTGVLFDAAVANVQYDSGSYSGSTNHAGEFQYLDNETVVFSIGGFSFAAVTASSTITLTDLLQAAEVDHRVVNLARLLQSLDTDSDPAVIALPETIAVDLSGLDFTQSLDAFSQDATVQAVLKQHGNQTDPLMLVPVQNAVDHLYAAAQELGVTLPDITTALDGDSDGLLNIADLDDDNDGVPDTEDAFDLDPNESVDTDEDGIGNNADPDDDNDNVPDTEDAFDLDPNESVDTDEDGIGNNADPDDDNDNVPDTEDAFDLDPNESVDTDGDGIGNNADPDDDNDNVPDTEDAFDLDPNETADADGDGLGDNADLDDDNDNVNDTDDVDQDNDGLIEISNLQQLDWIRNNPQGDTLHNGSSESGAGCLNNLCTGYELTTDLDFDINGDGVMDTNDSPYYDYDGDDSNSGWLPVSGFSAVFEGNGYEIRNLFINRTSADAETGGNEIGLFATVSSATVRNIGLTGALMTVTGFDNVGGLAGNANSSTFNNCYTTGMVSGDDNIGGLLGNANSSTFSNSYSTGMVTGDDDVGGLVGDVNSSTFTDSYTTGIVTGDDDAGGLAGEFTLSTCDGCYATGAVTGRLDVGGLLGRGTGSVINSYATGTVTGDATTSQRVGGLIGRMNSITLVKSYATGTVTGAFDIGGLSGQINDTIITTSYATGSATGTTNIGGLAGAINQNSIVSTSYATGAITAEDSAGGLAGVVADSDITTSYSSGAVTATTHAGGLVGYVDSSTLDSVYWASDSSGQSEGLGFGYAADTPNNTITRLIGALLSELQCPTAASDTNCVSGETLYFGWDDIDHDLHPSSPSISPWVFGDTISLPLLDMTIELQTVALDDR